MIDIRDVRKPIGDVPILKGISLHVNKGETVVIVTHEMQFARSMADRVIFLDQGVVIEEGPPDQLFDRPAQERTRQFLHRLHWMKDVPAAASQAI
ncbi:amino acid ABC transporter ATP-binding protein [Paenibacillus thiaminolyticus]|uniref:amino acid ABC transporter ATP-binding protein n=1 Tax=Paenibacillus thiaminolyticus TaxID=49283 RepID=UPI00234FC196|nr:amino acid ABC transporter ATP-binding protein [Paenibacillus thiaminolyticus]WCR25219.1 amino acid ABC transporter ATP-binding protein [Paenibacillus thiaminolyticus]